MHNTMKSNLANLNTVTTNQGGTAHTVNDLEFFRRFLFTGSSSNFYETGTQITKDVFNNLFKLINDGHGMPMVNTIHEVTSKGLAPTMEYSLAALACIMQKGDVPTKSYIRSLFNEIVKTGSHLLSLVDYLKMFGSISSSQKKTICKWYEEKTPGQLEYQLLKYRNRSGWTHRDVMRQVHFNKESVNDIIRWAVRSDAPNDDRKLIHAFIDIQKNQDIDNIVKHINEFGMTWEMIPTAALTDERVLRALSMTMPMTASMRYLNRFTIAGLTNDRDWVQMMCNRLSNEHNVQRAKIHPLNAFVSMKTYADGRGVYGSNTWAPHRDITHAMNTMIDSSFKFVEKTNKKICIGLDVSGSMQSRISGKPVSSLEAAYLMVKGFLRGEGNQNVDVFGFSNHLLKFDSATIDHSSYNDLSLIDRLPFGGTNPNLLIDYATEKGHHYDAFVFYTDNETGNPVSVMESLREYRRKVNPNVKMIIHAFAMNHFSLGDGNDKNILNIAGLDASGPAITQSFIRGDF